MIDMTVRETFTDGNNPDERTKRVSTESADDAEESMMDGLMQTHMQVRDTYATGTIENRSDFRSDSTSSED